MAKWDKECLRLFEEGSSYNEIAKTMGLSWKQVNHALTRARKKQGRQKTIDPVKATLAMMQKGKYTKEDICNRINKSPKHVDRIIQNFINEGYRIEQDGGIFYLSKEAVQEDKIHKHHWNSNLIKVGIVSDVHLNSKWQQLTHLNAIYDLFVAEGITNVYNAGDITAGENMFKGQNYEVFNHGADAQTDYVIEKYPKREGITTHFITGNHDLSFFKSAGVDIGVRIGQREDMNYLGQLGAYIEVAPGVDMYLLHPDGGVPYAVSYKPQKIISSFTGGRKPKILIIGHYHQSEYLFDRNVHCLQAGCFEGQTKYLMRKALMPKIGGWIAEFNVHNGTVNSFTPRYIPFFKEIKEDY